MSLTVPDQARQQLEQLDRELPILKHYEMGSLFRGAINAEALAEEQRKGAEAESWVFNLYSKSRGEVSAWGTHFGPMASFPKEDGSEAHYPDIDQFDAEVFDHWKERSKEAVHPVLRARYADAVWDLQERAIRTRPEIEYAQIAVDAYLEIVDTGKHDGDLEAIFYIERALQIALTINSRPRIDRAKSTMLCLLERSKSDPKAIGLWSFAFDALYDPRNKQLALDDDEQTRLVSHLEDVLLRCSTFGGADFSPWSAQSAAQRLAKHYNRLGHRADVQRVIQSSGRAFEAAAEKADPILAMAWLQPVIDEYHAKGMPEDAKRAQLLSFEKGKSAKDSLKKIAMPIEITREEFDAYIESLVSGGLRAAILKITARFIPNAEEVRKSLKDMKNVAPLSSVFPIIRVDVGRFVASAGSVDSDPEGRLIMQIAENLQLNSVFLDAAIEKAKELYRVDGQTLAELLYVSPAFDPSRRETVCESLQAYCDGDYAKFVSIALPQVEHVLRYLLGLMGQPMFKPARQGTMDVKNLNDVLREDAIKACLKEDIQLYLLTFLADRRGVNLRNDFCHGLLGVERIGRPLANQLLHVLLTLSLVRENTPEEAQSASTGEG